MDGIHRCWIAYAYTGVHTPLLDRIHLYWIAYASARSHTPLLDHIQLYWIAYTSIGSRSRSLLISSSRMDRISRALDVPTTLLILHGSPYALDVSTILLVSHGSHSPLAFSSDRVRSVPISDVIPV